MKVTNVKAKRFEFEDNTLILSVYFLNELKYFLLYDLYLSIRENEMLTFFNTISINANDVFFKIEISKDEILILILLLNKCRLESKDDYFNVFIDFLKNYLLDN